MFYVCRSLRSFTASLGYVLVAVAAANAQSGVRLNPAQISLAAPAGSTTPAIQTVSVLSRTQQDVPFSASVRYLGSDIDWLTVTPSSGTTPATLTMRASAASLAPGMYLGQLTVNSGAFGATADVVFLVGSSSSSTTSLLINPTALTFVGGASTGTAVLTQAITVTGRNPDDVIGFRATANSTGNWLSVTPFPGSTPATLAVFASASGLPSGTYTGAITLAPLPSGNPTVVPVTMVVVGNAVGVRSLELSNIALSYTYQVGTAAPPLQTVGLVTTHGVQDYTASTTASWIRMVSFLNPNLSASITDYAPGTFSVSVDPTGLAQGTHVGTINITAPGLPSLQLPVSLTITGTPGLNANPSSVILSETANPTAITITGTSATNLPFNATVVSTPSWLTVSPTSGTVSSSIAQTLIVQANTNGLAAGSYNGSITLNVQGSTTNLVIPVRLDVSPLSSLSATLVPSVESVELVGVIGEKDATQTFRLETSDGVSMGYTVSASSTGGWLTVEPYTGRTPETLTVTAKSAYVSKPGEYAGSILLTSLTNGNQVTVPVTYRLEEPAFQSDPASLAFSIPRTGAAPEQRVNITANAPTTFNVSSPEPWIKYRPTSATTPAAVTVWIEMSLLPPGSNGGTLVITGPRSRLNIPVSAITPDPPAPTATPDAIAVSYVVGAPAPAAQTITIGSTTGDPLNYTVTAGTESGAKWLSVTPTSGISPGSISVSIDPSTLVPGRHAGIITVSAGTSASQVRTIPVVVNVANAPLLIEGLLHAATLAPTPVAPGQIVTLTGTGLGPTVGVTARPTAAGAIDTRLGDIRVLFDGVAAPVLYVRSDQVNAIAPYALYGRSTTRIQVVQGESWSLAIDARVVDAAPGLFTIGGMGQGPASALNEDYSSNSATNPAARGSIVTLFGTGEGQTEPRGQDGRIISTDIRRPLLPVSARIGGRPAEVTYIGSAPGQVSGMFQVNLRVPENVPSGSVPVVVEVGGIATQSGVTIAVR